jgi:ubiquinone/menaquinone biosynthesis C-methylase UbiE
MGFYDRYILPHLTDLAMRNRAAALERARYVPLAIGNVLEIGAGSALNLPFYGPRVERLVALEPSPERWKLGYKRADTARFPVEFLPASAEAIPAADRSFDSVVMTWSLCTIADPAAALAEIARVLKPAGRLIFVEHGKAPDAGVAAWQDRLNLLWRPAAGGCNMNRPIASLIAASGLVVNELEDGLCTGSAGALLSVQGQRDAPALKQRGKLYIPIGPLKRASADRFCSSLNDP